MNRRLKINQAYVQKPWRRQLQLLGLFLAGLILFALIAGINLSVNARAATIGRQIQFDRVEIEKLENEIIKKQSLLAELTSTEEMEKRALEMGFRPATSDEILYLVVEGYYGRRPVILAYEGKSFIPTSNPTLSAEFTQSLFEWIFEITSFPQIPIGRSDP